MPRGGTSANDNDVTCDWCGKVCKSRGGLKLHRRACLTGGGSGLSSAQTPAGGVSRDGGGSGLSSAQIPTIDVDRYGPKRWRGRCQPARRVISCRDPCHRREAVDRVAAFHPPATVNGSVAAGAGHFSSGLLDRLSRAQPPLLSSIVDVPTHCSVARRLIVLPPPVLL